MFQIFRDYKKQMMLFTEEYLNKQMNDFSRLNRWGKDLPVRFLSFIGGGKMIRGGMALLSAEMYGVDVKQALPLGVAMEFFQSAFLIHDDIMDLDEYRRGEKSLYYQYQELFRVQGVEQDLRAGQSLAICAGDLALFWAYELLNMVECAGEIRQELVAMASTEYAKVTLAQMEDVYFGFCDGEVSEEEILNVYRYKTARYTFSLPLMAGAIFAGVADSEVELLARMGEQLGLIFQIKDDELGIFGESDKIGKPAGSDVSENKKTLFRFYLMRKSSETERERLSTIFGKQDLSDEELIFIRKEMQIKGVIQEVGIFLEDLEKRTRKILQTLRLEPKYRKILETLIDYSLFRKV